MNPLDILRDHINALLDGLSQTQEALESAALAYQSAPSASRTAGRDLVVLKRFLRERKQELSTLKKELEQAPGAAPARVLDWWKRLGESRRNCKPLFAECLAYAVGPLTRGLHWRGERLDGGLCPIADEMLEELTVPANRVWSRRTVLADSEFLGGPEQIIRLRFPLTALWDLPVAAHEFGHLVALGSEFFEPIGRMAQKAEEVAWLFEHFADVFATCVLGPAFACTCLLTRFDPAADLNRNENAHPSDGQRSQAILWTLATMEQDNPSSQSERELMSGRLALAWNACRAAATPVAGEINLEHRSRLDRWLPRLYALARQACSQEIYGRWIGAEEDLAPALRAEQPSPPAEPGNVGIIDILNGAWSARIDHCETPYQVGIVTRTALAWCRAPLERRGPAPSGA